MNLYYLPTPGFQGTGSQNAVIESDNPRDQRKDASASTTASTTTQINTAFSDRTGWPSMRSRRLPVRPHRLGAAEPHPELQLDRCITNNLINEFSYSHSLDEVFINVFTESGLHQRSRTGINYPYIFPDNKEIEDKIPTINIDTFTGIDGGPCPGVLGRSDPPSRTPRRW